MTRERCDVLVLGAGFAGSLIALLLERIGRSVVLVDRGTHPRFAIGESSTPLADMMLRRLAGQYDLPRLLPLTRYGDWKRTYPHLGCGLKRGFSYFGHRPGMEFSTDCRHSHELLVAASSSDASADTHWRRSDVDAFLFQEAGRAGIRCFDRLELTPEGRHPWVWSGERAGATVQVQADFVVDATGPAAPVARAVAARPITGGFETQSRSIYAHVQGLPRWELILDELAVPRCEYPFRCDAAAVHHLLDEGWMWQLRFDDDVTSVGLLLTDERSSQTPSDEWSRITARYPSLARQFVKARVVAPGAAWQATDRLQRRWSVAAGDDWALLPSTAGFIDPLHSTGIAHSLFGIERLVAALEQFWGVRDRLPRALAEYDRLLQAELSLIDHLVAAGYDCRRNFPAFVAATMLYFIAVTTCERRCLEGDRPAFLAADDEPLFSTLLECCRELRRTTSAPDVLPDLLESVIPQAVARWNRVGLFSPQCVNMYAHTVPGADGDASCYRA